MLTARQAAQMFSISAGTLGNWRTQKRGPKFYRVGKKVLYHVSDLERWLMQEPVETSDSIIEK